MKPITEKLRHEIALRALHTNLKGDDLVNDAVNQALTAQNHLDIDGFAVMKTYRNGLKLAGRMAEAALVDAALQEAIQADD